MAAIMAQKKLDDEVSAECGRYDCISLPAPHNFGREEVGDLLQAEKSTADGSTEGDSNTSGASSTQNFTPLRYNIVR